MQHEVWVIVLKDRQGRPRGAEKVHDGAFFCIKDDADRRHDAFTPNVKNSYGVFPALIEILSTLTHEDPSHE